MPAHRPHSLDSTRCIVMATGGTAGHIMPALAVAEVYEASAEDVEILFVGTPLGLEQRLVEAAGYPLALVAGSPLYGVGWYGRLVALGRLVRGALQARRVLRERRVRLVVGFGGYAAAGAVLAARSLRLPVVLFEANAQPGIANRLLGRLADRVLLGYEEASAWFPPGKCRIVGIPVRPAYADLAARRSSPPAERALRVLVTGGSLGSSFLNRQVPEAIARLAAQGRPVEVWHQAGNVAAVEFAVRDQRFAVADLDAIAAAYQERNIDARVVTYIHDMAEAYEWADVAITCAGTALVELAAAGVPALAVPLSAAAEGHQSANARAFARSSGLHWIPEQDWSADAVAAELLRLGADPAAWREASLAMLSAGVGDAALRVVEACEAMIATSR